MVIHFLIRKKSDGYKNYQQSDDEKKDEKLLGDSGFDCNFCNGKNHFAKDCVLQMKSKKKVKNNDEAYYVKKIEDHKKINIQGKALIVEEEESDVGDGF